MWRISDDEIPKALRTNNDWLRENCVINNGKRSIVVDLVDGLLYNMKGDEIGEIENDNLPELGTMCVNEEIPLNLSKVITRKIGRKK